MFNEADKNIQEFNSLLETIEQSAKAFVEESQRGPRGQKSEQVLRASVSKLLTLIFSKNLVKNLLFADIFSILNVLQSCQPSVDFLTKIMEWTQIIVSNTEQAATLDEICASDSFQIFVRNMAAYLCHEEVADYWMNLSKSIALRLRPECNFAAYQLLFEQAVLIRDNSNLLNTARRSVVLSVLKLKSPQAQAFCHAFPLMFGFVEIARRLVQITRGLDELAIQSKFAALQNAIFDLEESLLYAEEVISSCGSLQLKAFVANCLVRGFVMPVVMPPLRNDAACPRPLIGINVSMFVCNQILAFGPKLVANQLLCNVFVQNGQLAALKSNFDFERFHADPPLELAKRPFVQELSQDFPFEKAGHTRRIESKAFTTLLCFLKSKDDNMILNCSKLLNFVLGFHEFEIEAEEREGALGRCVDLLCLDPPLRRVTRFEIFALALKLCRAGKSANSAQNQYKLCNCLSACISQTLQALESPQANAWVAEMISVSSSPFPEPTPLGDKVAPLSLINYNFIEQSSAELKAIPPNYRHQASPEHAPAEHISMILLCGTLLKELDSAAAWCVDAVRAAMLELAARDALKLRNQRGQVVSLAFGEPTHHSRVLTVPHFKERKEQPRSICVVGREIALVEEEGAQPGMFKVLYADVWNSFVYEFSAPSKCMLKVGKTGEKIYLAYDSLSEFVHAQNALKEAFYDLRSRESRQIVESLRCLNGFCKEFLYKNHKMNS